MRLKEWARRDVRTMPWWASCIYVVALLLFGFDLVYLCKSAWGWLELIPIQGDSIPAWVQAIGSVAAIGVAIRISTAQDRRNKDEQARESYFYMERAFSVAARASAICDELVSYIKGKYDPTQKRVTGLKHSERDKFTLMLDNELATLRAVDPMKISDYKFFSAFIDLKTRVSHIRDEMPFNSQAGAPVSFPLLARLHKPLAKNMDVMAGRLSMIASDSPALHEFLEE